MSVGYHVNKPAGADGTFGAAILAAIDDIYARGMYSCAQIFVTGPHKPIENLGPEDKRILAARKDKQLVIHGAYIDNPWKYSKNSIGNIKREMAIAAEIGATGVIVHLGASTNDSLEQVLAALLEQPADVLQKTILWLEINHIKPSANSFETPAKLQALFRRVDAVTTGTLLQVGLCIDTAHLHSCGIDLSTYAFAQAWFSELHSRLPNMHLMFHLNDSNKERGSGADNHAMLATANIWGAYNPDTGYLPFEQSGLMAILEWIEITHSVTILERSGAVPNHDLELVQAEGFFKIEP